MTILSFVSYARQVGDSVVSTTSIGPEMLVSVSSYPRIVVVLGCARCGCGCGCEAFGVFGFNVSVVDLRLSSLKWRGLRGWMCGVEPGAWP